MANKPMIMQIKEEKKKAVAKFQQGQHHGVIVIQM
jgi:hypothetical protein